ncbi:MAG: 2-oxoglutarate dehydrogenase E1 component [Gammaproteobacteria bacterium]|jgi:2-oxoglutarate dehydrogenase E1 component|nr:2-oxoglutarate dehydrogenase E1 component [Gammaproteobacteria bacterium]
MTISMKELWGSSHVSAGHAAYLETLYDTFLKNPEHLSEDWLDFFTNLPKQPNSNGEISHLEIIKEFKNFSRSKATPKNETTLDDKQGKVIRLIQSYRNRGHLKAKLDPLGMMERREIEDLNIEFHGLSHSDLDRDFFTDTFTESNKLSLRNIIKTLEEVYCGKIGIECNHILDSEERRWFQKKFESKLTEYVFDDDEKVNIFERLNSADGLAKYLSAKYPGMKRFGIDGAEALVPLVESVIQNCGSIGASQICLGMAHRGRLNLLVNVLGKLPSELFSAFDEDFELEGASTGDVKYHLGFSSNFETPGGEVHVSLFNNPSHLEIVDPVVLGSVRARQDRIGDTDRTEVVPILLHGDASFSGQGVVMESLQMSQTRGFNVGGTIHIIVNNQIGFTTSNVNDSRSTDYSSDVAKIIQAPVIHVNGDDPEMVLNAAKIACKYRKRFKKDIVIDLFCYRRRGHNEADDPSATQPLMYQKISKHPSVLNQYEDYLINTGVLTPDIANKIKSDYRKSLEIGESVAKNLSKNPNNELWFDWKPYLNIKWWPKVDTKFSAEKLHKLGKEICEIPDSFVLGNQAKKIFEERIKMNDGDIPVNWGYAESMAYASLLEEGYPIRITGQDVRRGTFSHRHACVFDSDSGMGFIPLKEIAEKNNTKFDIYDSLLSEEAVLAFEYGYSATWPSGLTIWEAQFGDFANGAQVVIDQFIVSAQHKWERLSGLVMLLPHGYEGQGPEHSSARIERFLQLCATENIQVCVPSSPKQIFHLLRRQVIRKMRTPLIVISPKSLLRNPKAVSSTKELINGTFECVIDDEIKKNENVKKVIMCSGKVYYDLVNKRDKEKHDDIAIIRIEQLYPFPYDDLEEILTKYQNVEEYIWCQEEPSNQGAWFSHRHRIQRVLDRLGDGKEANLISRPPAAAPAVGLMKLHLQQQKDLINEAICK